MSTFVPSSPRSRRAGVAVAFVAFALLAGCTGGGKKSSTGVTIAGGGTSTSVASGDTTSSTVPPGAVPGATTTTAKGATTVPGQPGAATTTAVKAPTTTLKPTASAADVARAKSYLLTQSDVGADYKKSDENPDEQNAADFEKCGKGNPVFAKGNPNEFTGDVFNKGASFADAAIVGSSALAAASNAQASDAMAIVKTDEFLRCIEQTAKEAAAKNAPPGTTFDAKASRRPYSGADDAVDIHIELTGSYNGQSFKADVDAFVFRKGSIIAFAVVTVIGPTNAGEPARIAEIMKKKIG